MPARRDARGRWFYRRMVKLPDGRKLRISGVPEKNTKAAALHEEELHIARLKNPEAHLRKEVPTYARWFWGDDADAPEPNGRFWTEWVVANKNKPSEQESKLWIFKKHLGPRLGRLKLDQIDAEQVAGLRAHLVKEDLSPKRINNVLAVLSKSLRWAAEVDLIERAPRIRFYAVERPAVSYFEMDEYARLVEAARADREPEWVIAVLLGGEAGLRIGEILELRWEQDVDLVAGTLTIARQARNGIVGTPKGRTRRVVPMTPALLAALKRMPMIRSGLVVRNADGTRKSYTTCLSALERIAKRAGLPIGGPGIGRWHRLRHSFGTHAALLGVNPWRLQGWMGHKRIDETMRYVHLAEDHVRPIPEPILEAGATITSPDARVLAMLAARGSHVAANGSEQRKSA